MKQLSGMALTSLIASISIACAVATTPAPVQSPTFNTEVQPASQTPTMAQEDVQPASGEGIPASQLMVNATPTETMSAPLTSMPLTTLTPAGKDVADSEGSRIFISAACGACHSIKGVAGGLVGPDLSNIGVDAASRIPGMSAREYITESVVNPEAFVPTGVDRALPGLMTTALTANLSQAQVQTLVEYLLGMGGTSPSNVPTPIPVRLTSIPPTPTAIVFSRSIITVVTPDKNLILDETGSIRDIVVSGIRLSERILDGYRINEDKFNIVENDEIRLVLKKDPQYVGQPGSPDFSEVHFIFRTERIVREAMLLTREAEAIYEGPFPPATPVPTFTPGPETRFGWYLDPQIPINDPKLRSAVGNAINERGIAPNFFHLPNWPSLKGASQSYDPELARELLQTAGYDPGTSTVCVSPIDGNYMRLANSMVSDLREIGMVAAIDGASCNGGR